MRESELTQNIIKGTRYLTVLTFLTYCLRFIRIIILARLLPPSVFGIFSLAVVLDQAIQSLSTIGTEKYLIQRENVDQKITGAVYCLNILRGALIAVLIIVLSPFYSKMVNEPTVLMVLWIISLAALLRGFISPKIYLKERDVKFRQISIYEFTATFVQCFIVILLAIIFNDVRALAWGIVVSNLFKVILSFQIFGKPDITGFSIKIVKEILNVSKHFFVIGAGSFVMLQFDKLILGMLAGSFSLGLYSVAQRLCQMPLDIMIKVINRISLPIFSRYQNDKSKLNSAAKNIMKIHLAFLIPVIIVFIILADPLIAVIFGPKWIDAVPIFRMLTLVLFGRGLVHVVVPYIIGTGHYSFVSKIKIFEVIIFTISVTAGTYLYGAVGTAFGAGVGYTFASIIRLGFLCKHAQISILEITGIFAAPVVCIIPGIVINHYLLQFATLSGIYLVIVSLSIQLFLYYGLCLFFQKDAVRYLRKSLLPYKVT